jgi:predicted nucleotidyltransferase
MQLEDAIRKLKDHEADLKKMGVKSLYMFGSTIRGDQRPDSDVDMFFDYSRNEIEGMTIFRLMDIEDMASEILGCKTDIMTRDSIHPLIRQDVESTALQVF